jgi:hypothetical protein
MSNPGRSRPRATLTHVARTRLIIARTGVGGELLNGATIDMPPIRQTSLTYKRAPKAVSRAAERPSSLLGDPETS